MIRQVGLIWVLFLLLYIGFGSVAASAENAPECDHVIATLERVQCFRKSETKAEHELTRVYSAAIASISKDSDIPTDQRIKWKIALRDAERAWIKFREKDCGAPIAFEWYGGSGADEASLNCELGKVIERTRDLSRRYLGGESGSMPSQAGLAHPAAPSSSIVMASPIAASSAAASDEAQGTPSASSWELNKSVDDFTGKQTCVITSPDQPLVEIDPPSSFFVSLQGRGGVAGYRYRIDQQPASPMRLPTKMESDTSTVIIEGQEFARVVAGTRLRIEILTVLSSVLDLDLNLRGIRPLLARARAECGD